MPKDAWYLEKGGVFYGPFTAARVHGFLSAGKIGDDARVADNKGGAEAQPIKERLDLLKAMAAAESERDEKKTAAAHRRQEPEWFLMDAGKSRGPFTLDHVKHMYAAGKLGSEAAIRRDGSRDIVPLASLAVPPAVRSPALAKGEGTAAAAKEAARRRPVWLVLPLIGLLVLLVGWFLGKRQPQILKEFQQNYDKTSPLRRMARKANLPPFNEMVQDALRVGLNFSHQKVVAHHAEDIENRRDSGDGEGLRNAENLKFAEPAAYEPLFPGRVARVYSYIADGAMVYSYLVDRDGLVFAVTVANVSFSRLSLADYEPADFAEDAVPEPLPTGDTAWVSRPAPGVLAKAVWTPSAGDLSLSYLLVMNDE